MADARVLVAGASGFAGALAAQLVWEHPSLELAAITSRSDVGTPLRELYPRYRVPLVLSELDPDLAARRRCGPDRLPPRRRGARGSSLRSHGVRVVDLSADFRLPTWTPTRAGMASTERPALFGKAVYGLTELHRDELRGAELAATPGCYPTATVLALAPLAERGLVAEALVDAMQGVSGAGRGAATRCTTRTWTRTPSPTRPRATATGPRSSRSWRRSAARLP